VLNHVDTIDDGRAVRACPRGPCHCRASGLIGEVYLILMDAIFDVAVVICHPAPVIVAPMSDEVVIGVVFVCEIVVGIGIAYDILIRIGDLGEVPVCISIENGLILGVRDGGDSTAAVLDREAFPKLFVTCVRRPPES